jgi:hypothetical protein
MIGADTGGSRVEIGRVLESDLEAIGRLHVHFWGEVSDIGAMAETLNRLDADRATVPASR